MKKIVAGKTLGLDLGDRTSYYVVIDRQGETIDEGRTPTRSRDLLRLFERLRCERIVMEAGTHSGWVSRLALSLGLEACVANPRQVPLIWAGDRKTDRRDAETLGRLGRLDPKLLKPIRHRDLQRQQHLLELRCRQSLVDARTALINTVRGHLKQFGLRAGACSSGAFARRAAAAMPEQLEPSLGPLLGVIEDLTLRIRACNGRIGQLCRQVYPETGALLQIRGVGPITALAYVLTLESPRYFRDNRQAGAYVGLTPRKDQSGQTDKQLGITKAGDVMLRKLLVNCAHYMLGPFGVDSDLRRFGIRMAARGGSGARNRAVVAVARKLAVLLMCLWRTQVYEPLYNSESTAAA